jgi:hypothetical protein
MTAVWLLTRRRSQCNRSPGVKLVPPERDHPGELGVVVAQVVQLHEQGRQLPLFGAVHRGSRHVSEHFTPYVHPHDTQARSRTKPGQLNPIARRIFGRVDDLVLIAWGLLAPGRASTTGTWL